MLLRAMSTDVDVSTGERTVTGLIAPYDTPAEVDDGWGRYSESFARGAFSDAIARPGSVKFLAQHNQRAMPLGVAAGIFDSERGAVGTFKVSKTRAGDEYLELARDGAMDGLSVGFVPVDPGPDHYAKRGEQVVRRTVRLNEVSGVTWPAYDDARLSEVRSALARDALARAGKTLSSSTMAELRHALALVAAADDAVDEAQVVLSALMGVPNPDHDEPDADDKEPPTDSAKGDMPMDGRGHTAALLARRMRVLQLTSTRWRAESAARAHKEN